MTNHWIPPAEIRSWRPDNGSVILERRKRRYLAEMALRAISGANGMLRPILGCFARRSPVSMKLWRLAALLGASVAPLVATVAAQQTVPFAGGIPVAPHGLAARPLPDKPVEFDTAEGQKIRVVVVTKALEYPWSLAFLPDASMLVTERAGRLRIIRNGVLDPQPIAGGPASYWTGESGLPGAVHGYMDVALHPRFAENHYVYLTYTKPLDEKRRTVAIARGRFDGHALTDVRDIFVADAAGT